LSSTVVIDSSSFFDITGKVALERKESQIIFHLKTTLKAIQIVMKLHESEEYDLKGILEDVDDLSWDCLGLIQ
jgi:hypothetical protein